jgi:phage terminase large subunit-like protein
LKPRGSSTIVKASDIIDFIETHCRIPEGPDVGEHVRLRQWQKECLVEIYDNPHGTERAILSFGRKNAKTTLAAFILLAHLVGPKARKNAQLYSTAQSQEQAALVFDAAVKMIRMSPSLGEFIKVRDHVKELYVEGLGTKYKALSAETKTAYGLSPSLIIHDELGQVRGPASPLFDALETATGAQKDPLTIIISTQAATDADLLSVLIDQCQAGFNPRHVCKLYTASEDLDPFDPETIKLANPAYGDFLQKDRVDSMALDAKVMPARESEFRNLVLNQRVDANAPFVSKIVWNKCATPLKSIDDVPQYAGLDLSATSDLTAFCRIGKVDGIWQMHGTYWLPSQGLREKSRTDRVPYDVWAKEGHLQTSPGGQVAYECVAEHIMECFRKYDLRKVAFDRWGIGHFRPWLLKAGFTERFIEEHFIPFGQGTMSMTPALRVFEGLLVDQKCAHGGNPVLSMCAANAVVDGKDESCRKLSKAKSTGRIDGMVAFTMAYGVAPLDDEREFTMMFV